MCNIRKILLFIMVFSTYASPALAEDFVVAVDEPKQVWFFNKPTASSPTKDLFEAQIFQVFLDERSANDKNIRYISSDISFDCIKMMFRPNSVKFYDDGFGVIGTSITEKNIGSKTAKLESQFGLLLRSVCMRGNSLRSVHRSGRDWKLVASADLYRLKKGDSQK